MSPIGLSKRMQKIVELIPECTCLADIGTDHAFIPIHAVQIRRVDQAIATDLRAGPLQKARENVRKHGLSESIDLRLGDGLAALAPGQADVIVSAGIGGHVHADMVQAQPDVARAAKRLIFQPMNAGHLLRQRLDRSGYRVEDEALVLDDDKIYEIILVQPSTGLDPAYDPFRDNDQALQFRYTYGPLLSRQPDALFLERIDRELDKLRGVQKRVAKSENAVAHERVRSLQKEIESLLIFRESCSQSSTRKGTGR